MAVSVSVCCAGLRNFIPNFGHSSRAGGAGKVWDGERDHIRLNKLDTLICNMYSVISGQIKILGHNKGGPCPMSAHARTCIPPF